MRSCAGTRRPGHVRGSSRRRPNRVPPRPKPHRRPSRRAPRPGRARQRCRAYGDAAHPSRVKSDGFPADSSLMRVTRTSDCALRPGRERELTAAKVCEITAVSRLSPHSLPEAAMNRGSAEAIRAALRRSLPLIVALVVLGAVAMNLFTQPGAAVRGRRPRAADDERGDGALTGTQPVFLDPDQVQDTAVALADSPVLYERVACPDRGRLGTADELDRQRRSTGTRTTSSPSPPPRARRRARARS